MSTLSAALAYARILGWPLIPSIGKVPAIPARKGGRGIKDATTSESIIRRWWREYPNANIALAAGVNWWAMDVDPDKGGDEALDELVERYGPLPRTVMQLSGGGGRHYLFQPVPGLRNWSGLTPSGRGIGKGIDVRTVGASIHAAPSVHPETGALYQWAPGLGPRDVPIQPAPRWLVMRASAPEPDPPAVVDGPPPELPHYAKAALAHACDVISIAGNGSQNGALNGEAYSIGRLVGGGVIEMADAERCLISAGMRMENFNTRRPWTRRQVEAIVKRALLAGALKPKRPQPRS